MIQCVDCEFYSRNADGSPRLTCDPFSTIKEPECLGKWQLVQLQTIAKSHKATLDMYAQLAPIQERMFRHMERELDEADEADRWKYDDEDENDDDEDSFDPRRRNR